MHLHHFTLKALSKSLEGNLIDSELVECFSQSKDELVMGFEKQGNFFFLRISCENSFQFVCPFDDFRKAKKNTVNLFPEIVGRKVESVSAPDWERLILINFKGYLTLALKMHGGQSNLILLKSGKAHSLFKTTFESDLDFVPEKGNFDVSAITLPFAEEETIGIRLKKISPVLDRNFAEAVERKMKVNVGFENALKEVQKEANDDVWFLEQRKGKLKFLAFQGQDEKAISIQGIGKALQTFLRSKYVFDKYSSEYNKLSVPLEKQIKTISKLVEGAKKGIEAIANDRNPEEIGNLMMAQLHLIVKGATEVELDDYYQEGKLKVKLKPDLEPQQNATAWYHKSKKMKSKLSHLTQQLGQNSQKLARLEKVAAGFLNFKVPADLMLDAKGMDPQELRLLETFVSENESLVTASGDIELQERKHPYLEFNREGFSIYVGRSARSNDQLTFHFSKREDLWLHVKDAPGSHVIIRRRPGREFPKSVIEFAASLAAGHSPRKTEGLVPVSFTLRKFVRKPKGAAAGLVIVDREETVLVEPKF